MPLLQGEKGSIRFRVTEKDMQLFQEISHDRSKIHVDSEYAQHRGYREKIVYGGILLAQLSNLLGNKLPGDLGVSAHWSIDYRSPLYLNEDAEISIEITHVSPGLGLIEGVFSIKAEDRLIASGKVQTVVPAQDSV